MPGSGYAGNCVHTVHNARAAADIWPPKGTWTIKLRQLFHLAIPANEVINLAERVVEFPIDERLSVQRDSEARQSLQRYVWQPGRHGALLVVAPPYPDNEIFDTTRRIFVLEGPLRPKTRAAARIFEDERHTNLEANLRAFERIYEETLAGRPDRLDGCAAAYYAYIGEQRAEIRRQLAQLPLLRKTLNLEVNRRSRDRDRRHLRLRGMIGANHADTAAQRHGIARVDADRAGRLLVAGWPRCAPLAGRSASRGRA